MTARKLTRMGAKVRALRPLLGTADERGTLPCRENERPIATGDVGEVRWFFGRGERRVLGLVFATSRGPAFFLASDRPAVVGFEVLP